MPFSLLGEAKNALARARVFRRFAGRTGVAKAVTKGGLMALVQSRGKTNSSTVFRFHAQNTPHKTGLIYRDRYYSFYELNEQMDRVAAGLAARGIRPGDAVVLMLKNVPEFIFLQAGIARLGCSAVSVSWRSTATELEFLVKNSRARAIFFDASVADPVSELMKRPEPAAQLGDRRFAVRGDVPGSSTYDDLVSGAGDAANAYGADRSEEGAVIIYTSGTTGKPKGAVRKFSRDAVLTVLSFIAETPMQYGQTHLAVCPLYHSTAFGFIAFSYILGSTIVLLDGFNPESFLDAIERHRVDHTAVVPTMLHQTLALGREAIDKRDTSSLKAIFSGGAPLTGPLAQRTMDALGDKVFNFYGATETGVVTLAKPEDLRAAPGTIGRRVEGNEILLVGADGAPCAAGGIGELYVRSGNLVAGYHDNPEATRASILGDGFFSVGDLARCDERGYYFLEGRKRDMIISGGVNVYPREVEAALAEHEAIAEAAVVGVPDEEWGEIVHAFVGLHEDKTLSEEDLFAFCRARLAGPKRPKRITFMSALPRNPTGKVLKDQLRQMLATSAGGPSQ